MSAAPALRAPGGLPPWERLAARPRAEVSRVWPNPVQDLHADTLLAVTVQSRAAYEDLVTTGRLATPWTRVDPHFRVPYEWMASRIPEPVTGGLVLAPVWLWVRVDEALLVNELAPSPSETVRTAPAGEPGAEESVLLVAAVPRSRLVLSSHAGWHQVLNQTWLPAPGGRDDAYEEFEAAVAARTGRRDWTLDDLPADLRVRVAASWKICLLPDLWGAHEPVQAVTPWLTADEVVAAVRVI